MKMPGSGLVDFKVHVASSQDTQSALISNVELELGAPFATSKEHRMAKINAATFMAGIRGLGDLALGPECEGAVDYFRRITFNQRRHHYDPMSIKV